MSLWWRIKDRGRSLRNGPPLSCAAFHVLHPESRCLSAFHNGWLGVKVIMRKLVTIDCNYLYPEFAAAYLMMEDRRALFIENNTSRALNRMLSALQTEDLVPDQVEYLIITHVHLDHAGGTSALVRHCPNATVLAHPKAAKTIIDPSRLIASAKKVYGEREFDELYGEILPVDKDRVRVISDGETLNFGNRTLRFFYTEGHATHHFCVHDSGTNGVFTGDSFGLRYPALQKQGLFILPSTSPIDFDPVEAKLSLQKILETGAERAFVTHFGEVRQMKEAKDQVMEHLDAHERILEQAKTTELSGKALADFCEEKVRRHFVDFFEKKRWQVDSKAWDLLKLDIELNAAGIAFRAEAWR